MNSFLEACSTTHLNDYLTLGGWWFQHISDFHLLCPSCMVHISFIIRSWMALVKDNLLHTFLKCVFHLYCRKNGETGEMTSRRK
ncbi:hypothetical protein CISIN_1g046261mg [Citrus sinensis]|uniref:Uncharacterized protein n=1 Tax=Citrus sinensis TaxID=2711 RepID=A0A067DBM0_CITSI|nr:hypothetical protein CISIN_1g046261mg [Citrus sinensis]